MDPRYGSRKTREFVTGGLAGQLLLVSKVTSPIATSNPEPDRVILLPSEYQRVHLSTSLCKQGWLGSKDAILHSGEGPIQGIRWSGSLIAWANDQGVKVYDTTVHQRIAFIERPRSR